MDFHEFQDPKCEPGSIVRLRSGGPNCLVRKIEQDRVYIAWIDGGELAHADFPLACVVALMAAPDG